MTVWADVIARVQGLASRLLGRARLTMLATSHDLRSFAALLSDAYDDAALRDTPDSAILERHARHIAGTRLGIVARWSGARAALLAPLFEEDDRRNLAAIARGIVAGAPIEHRTSSLIPTAALPASALEELARQADLSHVAALLTAWQNPYGAALLEEGTREHPNLFLVLLALDRAYVGRAVKTARRAGRALLSHVRLQIDAQNAWTALALSDHAEDHADALFLEGGLRLSRGLFLTLARARDSGEARSRIASELRGTAVARVLADTEHATPEDALLAASLRRSIQAARQNPLDVGVILRYTLRLRAEVRDVARIAWGIALDRPREQLAAALVSP